MTRTDRTTVLKDRVRVIESIKADIAEELSQLTDEEANSYIADHVDFLTELDREYRTLRSEYDILYFAYEYFSEDCNPENDDNLIPAGVSIEDAPAFHSELCEKLEEQALYNKTKKICWASPRGSGKTMYLSNIYPIYSLVFKKRKFILMISETEALAKAFIEFIGNQLKFNEKLRADFGELLYPSKIMNDSDNLEGFVTTSGAKVKAASIGKQIRGARHGSVRPDLIICDDLESQTNTNTVELREKNLHWYNSVIVPVGTPESTGIIYMGTLVHGSGLLPNILNRADYDSKIYSSFLDEPETPELWQHYEEILLNAENANRLIEADNFYFEHQKEMDKGTATLWQARFPYKELIKKKVEIGSRAFSSEYLNRPSDPDSQIFNPDIFQYFDDKDLFDQYNRKLQLDIYGFWDIAIGKNKRSDYNAIITIGRDRRTGVIYVIDAWAAKVPVHKAAEMALQKIKEYKPKIFGVESVQAQYEMYRQLQQKCFEQGVYGTRLKPISPRGKKEERIEILEPLVENGILRFKKSQRLLIEQLEQFPSGDHDDLPDALASVVDLAGNRIRRTYQRKPAGI